MADEKQQDVDAMLDRLLEVRSRMRSLGGAARGSKTKRLLERELMDHPGYEKHAAEGAVTAATHGTAARRSG